MNAPSNSDYSLYSASESPGSAAPTSYAPSVPISVYRELATELKTTQQTLDALTKQNQHLMRQNKLLRHEIQRFVQAAEELGHFAGVMPPSSPLTSDSPRAAVPSVDPTAAEEPATADFHSPEETRPTPPDTRMSSAPDPARDRASLPTATPTRLFTEHPEGMRPHSSVSSPRDLSNLWLATTILLVVITAFGAGFLIMRPLLKR